jgi:tRNA dimethylallyltransferase
MGPTASGKTALAIQAAKELHGEVVSVDSALIYQDMDIGTAKPSFEEKDGIEHHLIDILSPELSYSVGDFVKDAQESIDAILARGKVPILAGGTMMYFNALINGINQLPASNERLRQQIQTQIAEKGLDAVHQQLQAIDPDSAQRIHPNDPQRITRALEVFLSSGKTLHYWQAQDKIKLPYDFVQFSIMPAERAQLHKNIALRFDQMLAQGFVDEVRQLCQKYTLHPDMSSLRSVGYRQVWQYLQGEVTEADMREKGIIATRQLAKRQVTWLRGWQDAHTLETGKPDNLDTLVEKLCAT